MVKLTDLRVTDFLGVRHISAPLSDRVLFAGNNGAGKSSLQNAIRLAVCGEFTRLAKLTKKDYAQVIHIGGAQASVTIKQDDGPAFSATIEGDGTLSTQSSGAAWIVDYLLEPSRFAGVDIGTRRKLLLSLSRQQLSDAEIMRLMVEYGASVDDAHRVLEVARAGWDTAEKWCHEKAKVEKSDWKKLTGEVAWGIRKGEGYVVSAESFLRICEDRIGPFVHAEKAMGEVTQALADLEKRAREIYGAMAVASTQATCPKCKKRFRLGTDQQASERAAALDAIENERHALNVRKAELAAASAKAAEIRAEMAAAVERAQESTRLAALQHESIVRWQILEGICSSEGIPRHLIGDTIKTINDQLARMAGAWTFGHVTLHGDMTLRMDSRPYPLLSESEKWVADACIAAALALVSGEKILMLDRLDVLSPSNRLCYIEFANWLAGEGVQTIAFATLKTKPEIENFTTYWINGGLLE